MSYIKALVGGRAFGGEKFRQAGEVRDKKRAVRRGVESVRQRERREDVAAVERDRTPPDAGDGLFPPRENPAGQIPERNNYLGIDGRELGDEVRPAGAYLRRLRWPWRRSRRAALYKRGQVDLLAPEVERASCRERV